LSFREAAVQIAMTHIEPSKTEGAHVR
jgi:hypothetical protein